MSKLNFQFTVLSFEKKDRFKKERGAVASVIRAFNMEWVPLWLTSKPPVLSKIYDRWKLRRKAFKLYGKEKFDTIHCRSYVAAEIGLKLKKKFNVKFLFDMRGFWADERVEGGLWNLRNPIYYIIYHYFKRMERKFL